MKISLITVSYNAEQTIRDTIESVLKQGFDDLEYIIIDGGSDDGTMEIVDQYRDKISNVISEKDDGVYSGMNKGITLASGDIIGFLNADDIFDNNYVLQTIKDTFISRPGIDACYSDLVYVDKDKPDEIVRYWKSCKYREGLFNRGWVPAHPTFYVRRKVYERLGVFDESFHYAADYDLMMRFIEVNKVPVYYLPAVTVRMRLGGKTNKSISNILKGNIEIYKIAKNNHVRLSLFFPIIKPLSRIAQYFGRARNRKQGLQ